MPVPNPPKNKKEFSWGRFSKTLSFWILILLIPVVLIRLTGAKSETAQTIDKEIRKVVEDGYERAKHVLTEQREQLETLAKALLEYETLSGDEIKKTLAGEPIDRGTSKGPAIPAAGSSIPKAKRGGAAIGGPATAGA